MKHYSASPVKEEESAPVNGITNPECAEILEHELDGLGDSSQSSPSRSVTCLNVCSKSKFDCLLGKCG